MKTETAGKSALENIVKLNIEGMTCTNCALGIEKYLQKQGLEDVHVNFSTAEAIFKNASEVNLKKIEKGIEKLGYKVIEEASEEKGLNFLEIKFLFTLPFTGLLLAAMFINASWLHNPWLQLLLAIPVYLTGLQQFARSAYNSIKTGIPNMDVLVTLGSTAAFFYSLTGTLLELGPAYQYYETAASIITLILMGNVIEHRSVKQTTSALRELSHLQPDRARKINAKSKVFEWVDTKTIQNGDLIQLLTGDRVPVDGKLIEGEGLINESMITGESMPVEKNTGKESALIGGTLVENGSMIMQTTAVGADTTLAGIIRLVKEAQQHKPPIQRMADRVSAIFVPAVVLITILTFLLSWLVFSIGLQASFMHSVAVLVIACPCAMGLATPTAVMVGVGRAAKNGILIKGGATIEKLHKVKQVVFDKTGTLTTGHFKVGKPELFPQAGENTLALWAALENHSNHPLAQAIAKAFDNGQTYNFNQVVTLKGLGLKGFYHGKTYYAGSARFAAQKLQLNEAPEADVIFFDDQQLLASVMMEDEIKPGVAKAVAVLHKQHIKTILLSGDRKKKCKQIAEQVGIDQVFAEQMPDQKLEVIKGLSSEMPTAMIGDGINDAPALSAADLGISFGQASQVAIQSADVILLKDDMQALTNAFGLGKKTVLTIKQNLFWAFFYNVIAIPVAAIGLLNPMLAALSMAFSDVFVVGNSIRLRFKKIN